MEKMKFYLWKVATQTHHIGVGDGEPGVCFCNDGFDLFVQFSWCHVQKSVHNSTLHHGIEMPHKNLMYCLEVIHKMAVPTPRYYTEYKIKQTFITSTLIFFIG